MVIIIRTVTNLTTHPLPLFLPGYGTAESATIAPLATLDLLSVTTEDALLAMQPELERMIARNAISVVAMFDTATLEQGYEGGGGGGNPAGSDTQVQFNNLGLFGASSGFTYDESSYSRLSVGPIISNGGTEIRMLAAGNSFLSFDNTSGFTFAQLYAGGDTGGNLSAWVNGNVWTFDTGGGLTVPGQIHNLVDPTAPQDAATKNYVDNNGGGSPGGSNTQIQFNDNGNFGASSGLTYAVTGYSQLDLNPVSGASALFRLNSTSGGIIVFNDDTGSIAQYALLTAGAGTNGLSIQVNSGPTWLFDNAGLLTTPGNILVGGVGKLNADGAGLDIIAENGEIFISAGNSENPSTSVTLFDTNSGTAYVSCVPGLSVSDVTDVTLDPSAVVSFNSTVRGFLPPRMNASQRDAISSPVAGLQIYNTDSNQPEVFNGSIWTAMGGGGSGISITTVTSTYTAAGFNIIQADASTGAFTVTLPPASSSLNAEYTIKKIDSTANAITIQGDSSDTIDGVNTHSLPTQWSSLTMVCNGTSWIII